MSLSSPCRELHCWSVEPIALIALSFPLPGTWSLPAPARHNTSSRRSVSGEPARSGRCREPKPLAPRPSLPTECRASGSHPIPGPWRPRLLRGCLTVLGTSTVQAHKPCLTVAALFQVPRNCSELQSRDRQGGRRGRISPDRLSTPPPISNPKDLRSMVYSWRGLVARAGSFVGCRTLSCKFITWPKGVFTWSI